METVTFICQYTQSETKYYGARIPVHIFQGIKGDETEKLIDRIPKCNNWKTVWLFCLLDNNDACVFIPVDHAYNLQDQVFLFQTHNGHGYTPVKRTDFYIQTEPNRQKDDNLSRLPSCNSTCRSQHKPISKLLGNLPNPIDEFLRSKDFPKCNGTCS